MSDLDALTYPRWLHHAALPSVLVQTREEAAALPEGYRERTFTEEELLALAVTPANEPEPSPTPAPEEEPAPAEEHVPVRTRVPPSPPPPRRR